MKKIPNFFCAPREKAQNFPDSLPNIPKNRLQQPPRAQVPQPHGGQPAQKRPRSDVPAQNAEAHLQPHPPGGQAKKPVRQMPVFCPQGLQKSPNRPQQSAENPAPQKKYQGFFRGHPSSQPFQPRFSRGS